tara:strand:- start:231 stop:434 length:204 start_codon:yes stop_codon:yes gene_type:complete
MEPITKIIEIVTARKKIQEGGKYPIGKKSQSEQILEAYHKQDRDDQLHAVIISLLQESWRADKAKNG